ncbi:MAG: alpha-amylase family glycosyl hydrolase [Myxococcaceae bacterium]
MGNSLRVVGGTSAPVLFAPDRRHLAVLEDGTFVMHLESAGGPDPRLWLHPDGTGRVPVPLELVAERDGHRLLRARVQLPLPVSHVTLHFEGGRQPAFHLPAPRPPLSRPPDWLHGAVFYNVFIDRWPRGSGSANDARAVSRATPSSAQTFYGGDLNGVREGLAYLSELGIDALVLTPVHCSPTPHRYDATDLRTVEPALGGEGALRSLIDEAHRLGVRVVLDVAATHVNESHPAFRDVLDRQERSAHARWFRIRRFPVVARDGGTFDYYYDRPELPWLDLRPGPAREHVLAAVSRWVGLGLDGLRLDAMNDAPADFWRELRRTVRAHDPGLLLLGEVVSDNLARFAEDRGVDAATDFRHREAMLAFFARGECSAGEFWDRTVFDGFRTGAFDASFRLLFLDNHDTWRFLSVAYFYDRLRLALAYLLFRPEPVALNYGTELGLAAHDLSKNGELDDAWPERMPMPPLTSPRGETFRLVQTLTGLRRTTWGRGGPVRFVEASGQLLVLERDTAAGVVRAFFNAGDTERRPDTGFAKGQMLGSVNDVAARPEAPLGPWAGRFVLLPS